MINQTIFQEVANERVRQDEKWGADRNMPLLEWWAILSEEYGEVAHEVTDYHFETHKATRGVYLNLMRAELIQTAAVCVAMIEAIDAIDREDFWRSV